MKVRCLEMAHRRAGGLATDEVLQLASNMVRWVMSGPKEAAARLSVLQVAIERKGAADGRATLDIANALWKWVKEENSPQGVRQKSRATGNRRNRRSD